MKKTLPASMFLSVILMLGCGGTAPSSSVKTGELAPCPGKPNCVSSLAEDKKHFIEPFSYTSGKKEAMEELKAIISKQKRMTIVSETENYLHVESRTKFFKFVDDVEFYFPDDEQIIHIRSASRLGYSDLGVNRKRMEGIRELFIKKTKH
ncbi:conserved exported hypothetical protein [Desulfamplus magnetovallimortis]|uniref:DUF1499 domain-containing protein n=1 Tax=Desulfamplus magnetovallimortis TaxID=1246637 RepID=A0A1W1H8N7_9BACT|nr:DUF1499 domain-containing protein [Desulfamplus magnetovallimortis]SLM28755.1 conserved exported hypothetical protein [Desulfamplus magnetovallimortis]